MPVLKHLYNQDGVFYIYKIAFSVVKHLLTKLERYTPARKSHLLTTTCFSKMEHYTPVRTSHLLTATCLSKLERYTLVKRSHLLTTTCLSKLERNTPVKTSHLLTITCLSKLGCHKPERVSHLLSTTRLSKLECYTPVRTSHLLSSTCLSKLECYTPVRTSHRYHHHHFNLFLNREGRWGTTDDFTTSFLHFPLFSSAFWDLANSRPVHFLTLSSHLFLCLPCLLPPFTVPCKVVFGQT